MAAILAGLLVTRPAIAVAPKLNNLEIKEDEFIGPIPTSLQSVLEKNPIRSNDKQLVRPDTSRPHVNSYDGLVYSKEEVIQLIKDYSKEYGISADLPLRVAKCESNYNQSSKNRNSTASGIFQYIRSTWSHTEAGVLGISPFDADANVRMAIKSIASGGIGNWNASKSCWKS